jgi:hypothetical protein
VTHEKLRQSFFELFGRGRGHRHSANYWYPGNIAGEDRRFASVFIGREAKRNNNQAFLVAYVALLRRGLHIQDAFRLIKVPQGVL